MKTAFTNRFLKDIEKLPNADVRSAVASIIEAVEEVPNLAGIADLRKLKSYKNA